jgi:NitT/TauT family transport system permease protein
VLTYFYRDVASGVLVPHLRVTFLEVVTGFAFAAALGIATGSAIALIRPVELILYPYVLGVQTIPKIAIAPLLLIWFGYGMQSKVITAGMIAFFPILVNVIAGLRTIDVRRLTLMRSLKASSLQTFLKVRLPNMLPYLFAGFEVGIIFAIIGAIVGEFIGASEGLGSVIIQRQASADVAGVFSVLIWLSLMGVCLNLVIRFFARRYTFWAQTRELVSA